MSNDITINGCVYVAREGQRYVNLKEFGTCLRYYIDIPAETMSQISLNHLDVVLSEEMISGGVSCRIAYPMSVLNIYGHSVMIELFLNQNFSIKFRARISCISIQENEDPCFPYECSSGGVH